MTKHASKLLDHPVVVSALFYPRPDPPGLSPPANGEIFTFPTRDGFTFSVRCHFAEPQAPHLLFFHGNGEIAGDYDDFAPLFNQTHLSFLACDYRGYGANPGTPSGTCLLTDAQDTFEAVHRWLKQRERTGPLYLMGRSLGTAAVLEIAHHYQDQVEGLLFDSAFADTLPLLARIGVPVERFDFHEEDGFLHRIKIAQFHKPVLFLHGQEDVLTPLEDAQILHALCPSKKRRLFVIPGAGHNDTFAKAGRSYLKTIGDFIGHRQPDR